MTCRAEVSGARAAFSSAHVVYVLPPPYGSGSLRRKGLYGRGRRRGAAQAGERKGHPPIKSA